MSYFHSTAFKRAVNLAGVLTYSPEELNPKLASRSIKRAIRATNAVKIEAQKRARQMRKVRL